MHDERASSNETSMPLNLEEDALHEASVARDTQGVLLSEHEAVLIKKEHYLITLELHEM